MVLPFLIPSLYISLTLSPHGSTSSFYRPHQHRFLNPGHPWPSPLSPLLCFHRNGIHRQSLPLRRRRRQQLGSNACRQHWMQPHQHRAQSQYNNSCATFASISLAMIHHHFPNYGDVDPPVASSMKPTPPSIATTKLNKLRSVIVRQIFKTTTYPSRQFKGRIYLLLVALLYGTLNSTLRSVYSMDGKPVPSVLSFVRQLLSVVTFLPIIFLTRSTQSTQRTIKTDVIDEEQVSLSKKGISSRREQQMGNSRPVWRSALELAFWNFGAQGLINAGLLYTSAARASFLSHTSVVMTPLLSAFGGERIPTSVWGGCGLALVGLFLIATSATTGAPAAAGTNLASLTMTCNRGDTMILLGAMSWSMYIFRTTKLAQYHSALSLQFTKTVLLAVMYGGWVLQDATSTLAATAGVTLNGVLASLWPGWKSPKVWMLLFYSAIGPGVLADILQQRGQRDLDSASQSNIILCLESVFAAICAFVILGEVVSMREVAGGSLIVTAAILASR